MKHLLEYIFESSSDFLLLSTYEDAEKYFNSRPNLLDKFGITLDDVKVIYDIQAECNKTAPFVGCYKSNTIFAMRRWVDSKIEEWSERTNNSNINSEWFWTKIRGVYAGPHNTNLKEDGSYNPSAEDMESVVAFAVNKLLDPDYDDIKNIKYVCNDKTDKESQKQENLLNYYQDEYKFINNCAEVLKECNSRLHKLLTGKETVTDKWVELGRYKETHDSTNATPKTDLVSEDNKYKISLKKSGGSQLMSGSYNESLATILAAANSAKLSNDEIDIIKATLSTPWVKLRGNQKGVSKQKIEGSDEIKEQINNAEYSAKILNEFLNNMFDSNKKFKEAFIREAMTGETKFGKNSPLAANYVFVWSEQASQNKLYTIDEYIDHCMSNKLKIEIGWKTGGSTSIQNLRVVTK